MLAEYRARHPAEAAVVARFVNFVREHPRCFERDCWAGHVTGSAWLVNGSRDAVLLTHHKKLDRWLQVGGHSDGVADPLQVAIREAEEESGLAVEVCDPAIFDVDIHEIPARKSDPSHYHFDVRFALVSSQDDAFRVSDESHALAWVPVSDMGAYTNEVSVVRMAEKWLQRG